MRKILLLSLAVLVSTGLFAEILCKEKTALGAVPEIKTALGKDKDLVNLYSITLNYPAEDVKNALHERLDKEGISGSKTKNNFYAFQEVNYSYLWDKTCDIYVSVTGTKNAGTINLLISQGYDNFIDPYKDTITTEKAFKWLIAAEKVVADYIYEIDLSNHMEEYEDIEKELSKLEKEKNKIESKLEKNEIKQLKLDASKTVVSEGDLNVDSKKIAKEQKEALKLQKERNSLQADLTAVKTKIEQTKGDLNLKKSSISDLKKRNNKKK